VTWSSTPHGLSACVSIDRGHREENDQVSELTDSVFIKNIREHDYQAQIVDQLRLRETTWR